MCIFGSFDQSDRITVTGTPGIETAKDPLAGTRANFPGTAEVGRLTGTESEHLDWTVVNHEDVSRGLRLDSHIITGPSRILDVYKLL